MATTKKATRGRKAKAVKKMSYEEFVTKAITALRTEKSKGIHSVYSGFNGAFKEYYGADVDVIDVTRTLEEEGVISIQPRKGGVMLYLADEAPINRSAALEKILAL